MNLKFKHADRFASNSACRLQIRGASGEKRPVEFCYRARIDIHSCRALPVLAEIVTNGCTEDLVPRGPDRREIPNSVNANYSTDNMSVPCG